MKDEYRRRIHERRSRRHRTFTAKEHSKAGSDLIITDINAEGLKHAEKELSGYGVEVLSRVVDVM